MQSAFGETCYKLKSKTHFILFILHVVWSRLRFQDKAVAILNKNLTCFYNLKLRQQSIEPQLLKIFPNMSNEFHTIKIIVYLNCMNLIYRCTSCCSLLFYINAPIYKWWKRLGNLIQNLFNRICIQ